MTGDNFENAFEEAFEEALAEMGFKRLPGAGPDERAFVISGMDADRVNPMALIREVEKRAQAKMKMEEGLANMAGYPPGASNPPMTPAAREQEMIDSRLKIAIGRINYAVERELRQAVKEINRELIVLRNSPSQ